MKQSDEKITSNNYGHNISDGMIKTVKYNTSVDELKDQLDNDNSKLKIYLSDGTTEYTNDKVATGMIVKLIENDIVLDQKIIVVLGDTDGNGDINAELRQFICEILSGTYRVVGVADGVMALEEIEEEVPDFIITDIMMPRMDGIELIRHIKENVNTCDIPIIILSAKSSVEDRIQGLQLGIDDYIPKPFSSDYLKSRIENLIRQRKVLQSAFLSKYGAQPKKEPLEAIAYPVSQIVPLDELFMQKLVGFMEENYSNPGLRVNDLAEFMNMSRSVFNRKVNGIMGISPIEYIKNYRLNKAKSFIQSGMSFSEVAFAVGFSDPGYFGKAFKKAFNQTLTEYKNNN